MKKGEMDEDVSAEVSFRRRIGGCGGVAFSSKPQKACGASAVTVETGDDELLPVKFEHRSLLLNEEEEDNTGGQDEGKSDKEDGCKKVTDDGGWLRL